MRQRHRFSFQASKAATTVRPSKASAQVRLERGSWSAVRSTSKALPAPSRAAMVGAPLNTSPISPSAAAAVGIAVR